MDKLKLSKPFMFEGSKFAEIEYNLNAVTPGQYKTILKKLQKMGNTLSVPELDANVQQEYFAIASGIPANELERLEIKDFMTMEQLVRDFFLSCSDETDSIETETEIEDISE